MNRWMMVACATALASAGCTKSEVAADADLVLTGTVLRADKQPLANTLLKIHRSANSQCLFTILFDDLNWKAVKTGADGTFRQELLGADTQNGSTARCFELAVPGSGQGDSLHAHFTIQSEQLQLPTLQQWTGTPSAAEAASGVNVSYQDISAAQAGVRGNHFLRLQKGSADPVWNMAVSGSPALVNDELLEDAADLAATVSVYREVKLGKSSVSIYQKGLSTALPRRARVPASRGATCTYPNAPTPCPLTDGDLGTGVSFEPNTREFVVQLARPTVVRKAVLRNLATSLRVSELVLEGSADGTQWVGLANLRKDSTPESTFQEHTLTGSTPLSHVRVRASGAEGDARIERLAELSLFE